jgi:biotin transport system substrate-specific component
MRADNPTRDLGLIAVFAALIAAASLTPGVPIGPVPITLQTLAVMLAGLVLGPGRGFAATVLYVLVGLAGLPVFTGGGAGLAHLAKPSAGYLLSFPIAALVAGALAAAVRSRTPRWQPGLLTAAAAVASLAVIHPLGIVGLMINAKLAFAKALAVDVVFIPGDLVKSLLAGVVAAAVHRAFPALLARPLAPVEAESPR